MTERNRTANMSVIRLPYFITTIFDNIIFLAFIFCSLCIFSFDLIQLIFLPRILTATHFFVRPSFILLIFSYTEQTIPITSRTFARRWKHVLVGLLLRPPTPQALALTTRWTQTTRDRDTPPPPLFRTPIVIATVVMRVKESNTIFLRQQVLLIITTEVYPPWTAALCTRPHRPLTSTCRPSTVQTPANTQPSTEAIFEGINGWRLVSVTKQECSTNNDQTALGKTKTTSQLLVIIRWTFRRTRWTPSVPGPCTTLVQALPTTPTVTTTHNSSSNQMQGLASTICLISKVLLNSVRS